MIVVAMFHKERIPRDVIGQCIAVFDGARILSLISYKYRCTLRINSFSIISLVVLTAY